MKLTVTALIIAFGLAIAIAPIAIKYLISIKFGQSIREIGPSWHQKKSGTPTMGGFIFILPILISSLLLIRDATAVICMIAAVGFGAVGFIDDYIKVVQKRNLGLSAKAKFLLQIVVTSFFLLAQWYYLGMDTSIRIPFYGTMNLSLFYYLFTAFVMLACVNSVNLTDGIDGLAVSVSIIVLTFFGIAAFIYGEAQVCALCFAAVGGCLAFFIFNKNPARVFMGDTGSLFLGGLISAVAISLGQPVMILIAGIIFFIETLSVILQVFYFKIFRAALYYAGNNLGYNKFRILGSGVIRCNYAKIGKLSGYFSHLWSFGSVTISSATEHNYNSSLCKASYAS